MFEAWLTLGVIAVAMIVLVREWMAPDLLLLAALGLLAAVGIVELEQALSGFADPTLLAIGALFVVAAGLRSTGVLRKAADLLFGGFSHLRTVLIRLTAATAVSSAFLNNTPIVAMGVPAVLSWARGRDVVPSKLLIPLSYASILGGVCTLIGTSTNLVADGLLRAEGMRGLGFFELSMVGVPLALLGIAYLVVLAPRLLPDRVGLHGETPEGAVGSDIHLYRVPEESLAVGRTVQEAALGTPELPLVRIVRESGEVVKVKPATPLRDGDRLTFRGDPKAMAEAVTRLGLEPLPVEDEPPEGPTELREAVVPQGSFLDGERVADLDFRERYGAMVLGVVRQTRQLPATGDAVLRPGDTLLLVTGPDFETAYADSRDFHVMGGEEVEREALAGVSLWRPTQAKAGLVVLAGIVLLAATGVLHISLAALGGAVAMVAAGLVSPAEARRSVDWSVLIVIGAAIGLGTALTESGAAELVARAIVALGETWGPHGVLAALLLAAMLFTLVITNNAAVAILFPVALSVSRAQALDPRPFAVVVTVGASLAFATPLGYQTNLMVYGPGGYRFGDFLRAGLPLQLLLGIAAVILVPFVWPL